MKNLLPLLLLLLLAASCKDKKKSSNSVYNADFQWTMPAPEGFPAVSAEEQKKVTALGEEVLESTYEMEMENHTTPIFVFRTDERNYFDSNWQPFDPEEEGPYEENVRDVNDMIHVALIENMPDARVDSSASVEVIDGLLFYRFRESIHIPGKLDMEMWMYSRQFGNKDLTVSIMAADKQKEALMLTAFRASKFGLR